MGPVQTPWKELYAEEGQTGQQPREIELENETLNPPEQSLDFPCHDQLISLKFS